MISSSGFFLDEDMSNLHFDQNLCLALLNFLSLNKAKSVVDFGCGDGKYVKNINNLIPCKGYDGNPNTEKLSEGLCKVLDLSQPVDLQEKFDWVLSLEVGEHIPKDFESNFINNLHNHNTKGIIVSWAIPGQGGRGHYNEQPNAYIKSIFNKLGYINDSDSEELLRTQSSLFWFKNTIMVFKRW